MQNELLRRFKEFDIITILYAVISGIILVFASFKLDNIQTRILIRVAIIAIVVFIAFFLYNKNNQVLKIIRNFYILPVLLYFISEGDYINNILFPDLDRYMVNFELTLFSKHPGVAMSNVLHFKWFSEFMSLAYLMYYGLFVFFIVKIYRKNQVQYDYVAFLISMTIYMIFFIFMLCPVAGPQYYLVPPDNQIPDGYIFRDIARWTFLKTDLPASAFPSISSLLLCLICFLSFRNIKPLFKFILPLAITILIASVYLKPHLDTSTRKFIDKIKATFGEIKYVSKGSSLKLCMIAEGQSDIYPRFSRTMEWDTAAGHAIVAGTGGVLLKADTLQELEYNKVDLSNPAFFALSGLQYKKDLKYF